MQSFDNVELSAMLAFAGHLRVPLQTNSSASAHAETQTSMMDDRSSNIPSTTDLFCFSHLRWHFVFQRPQHLLTRCAKERRVFFWEEPIWDGANEGHLEMIQEADQLFILRPHLPPGSDADTLQRALLAQFASQQKIDSVVRWFYTPMAIGFSGDLHSVATIYDCMDELSSFHGAPPELRQREQQLLTAADVVFTGGMSLYEAKRKQHPNVHAFPSSIDVAHFQRGSSSPDPQDQSAIPHPRAGFYGVIDERFDHQLLGQVAAQRPAIHFILLGPIVKIDPAILPQAKNIHYLRGRSYDELPAYLAHWDAALLPFALNDATRFISPTKTPEYLAAGKAVVSTPIRDVISGYGEAGLVSIAADAPSFVTALDQALGPQSAEWKQAVAAKLATSSWDRTWRLMWKEVERVGAHSSKGAASPVTPGRWTDDAGADLAASRSRRTEHFDYIVVGAGFAGAVLAERLASVLSKRVLIIDKREHIAGNAYDYQDTAGILIHKYGPHIFHTNSSEVVDYLSRFTAWRNYEHRVLASIDGQLLPVPINIDTINRLYGLQLDAAGMKNFLAERAEIVPSIRTSEDIVVSRIGRELYQKFFQGYTRKQWGLDPSELDASVAGRIPVRFDHDDRYFTDTFQAMPRDGFTRMFERMLDHRNITVRTGLNYADVEKTYVGVRKIFTGPVDEYFGYRYGPLPYRSLELKHEIHDQPRFQAAPVVNYPNDHPYTRVTEFKYLTGQVSSKTSIVYEYPQAEGDPYYPIPRPENALIYARYKELADQATDVHFVGRLATYRYYNMDQVVAQALTTFRRIQSGGAAVQERPSGQKLAEAV